MAERRRELTPEERKSVEEWEKDNDYASYEEWKKHESGMENLPPAKYREDKANPNMHCKTCKFADKRYNGKPIRGILYPNWTAGSCEQYEEKPAKVYFDGAKCPKYEAK